MTPEGTARHPSVSVVVATRDRLELLRVALDRILEQRYDGDIECLVVFDQSDPAPGLVLERGNRRVRVLRNDRSPGLAGARNTGILAAGGQFVAFCDDDDTWLPDKLTRQIDALQARPDAMVAVCGLYVEYEGRTHARTLQRHELHFSDLLRSRVFEAHPSTYVARRQAVVDRIGLVDEHIPGSYSEDYEWLLRAAKLAPVVVVPEPLATVLWHRKSFFADRWQTIVQALDYLVGKYPEFGDVPAGLARILGQKAFAYAALGQSKQARHWALQALRANWREQRGYVALLVSTGLVSADRALRLAHAVGRGI